MSRQRIASALLPHPATLAVCLLVSLASATRASAQSGSEFDLLTGPPKFGEYEHPTQYPGAGFLNYQQWLVCGGEMSVSAGLGLMDVNAECFTDKTQENAKREEVVAHDRWIRSGVLVAAQVWVMIEQAKNIYQSTKSLEKVYDSIFKADRSRSGQAILTRIADNVDGLADQINTGMQISLELPPQPYDKHDHLIQAMALNALAMARDVMEQTEIQSDAAANMQEKLSRGRGDSFLNVSFGKMPPPDETEVAAMLPWANSNEGYEPTDYDLTGTYDPSEGGGPAPAASITAGSASRAARVRIAGTATASLISESGLDYAARIAAAAGTPAAAGMALGRAPAMGANDQPAPDKCHLPEDDKVPVQVQIVRATNQMQGAQATTEQLASELEAKNAEIKLLHATEQQRRIEAKWTRLLMRFGRI